MPKTITNCPECGKRIEFYPRVNHRNGAKHFCSRHCQTVYLARHKERKPIKERLLGKVNKNPENGCWEWIGCVNSHGYGQIKIEHKTLLASRVSWEIHRGEIPDGMNVCHICDNPPCINPDHLFLGTQSDNLRDCVAKGRLNNWIAAKKRETMHAMDAGARDMFGEAAQMGFGF